MENIKSLLSILREFEGLKIVKCYRKFYDNDEGIPESLRDQESDGNIYLRFSNGKIIGFYPSTEDFSIFYEFLNEEDIQEDCIDITDNEFWKVRSSQMIRKAKLINSEQTENIMVLLSRLKTQSV